MNAPARIPQDSARITYRGRDQFVAHLPRHRSAVWQRPGTLRRIKAALIGGPLTPRQAALTVCLGAPLASALLAAAWILLP